MVFLAGAEAIKVGGSKDHVTITLSSVEGDRTSQREYDEVLKDKEDAAKEAKVVKEDQTLQQKTQNLVS